MSKKIYVVDDGLISDITSVFDAIQNEKSTNFGLSKFSDELLSKHFEFLERLSKVTLANHKDLASFVEEAQESIDAAELDTTLFGDFRETNLDWAYLKRKDVREYAEALLEEAKDENTRQFCTTAIRKMSR